MASTGVSAGYQRRRFSGFSFYVPPPTSPVAGYTAWFDSSQISGQADASSLHSWADLSASGYTLTVADTAYPTYYKTTSAKLVNGLPAVWFNGSSSGIGRSSCSPTSTSGWTAFVVAQNTAATDTGPIVAQDNASVQIAHFLRCTSGTLQARGWDTSDNPYTATAGSITNGQLFQATGICTGTSLTARLNGVAGSSTSMPNTKSGSSDLSIGTNSGFENWTGPICEVLLYNAPLSAANISANEAYLSAKWAT